MTTRLHVLVIDDDPGMQSVLKRGLERQGHVAVVAGDGATALQVVEDQDPDIVLLDLRLPETSGKLLYGKLLELRPQLEGRVIVMGGDVEFSAEGEWFARQGLPVLSKPFELRQLFAAIEQVRGEDHS